MRDLSKIVALALLSGLAGCTMSTGDTPNAAPATSALMTWPDLVERPRPAPNHTISYGEAAEQVVDLWLPQGAGPHPVVLMVHGGCWQTEIADRTIMNWIADDLRRRGYAVWNIDYSGVDRPGGGFPGTFLDAAAAADALRNHSERYNLATDRVVAIGHSAGGHLALWLAARHTLRPGDIFNRSALPIASVVSLGGLPDLELAERPPGSGCGTEVIGRLIGRGETGRTNLFDRTSIPRMGALGIPQVLINGNQDRIIPTHFAEDYARKMRALGDDVRVRMIDGAGHVELVAPESAAWAAAVEEIERALR